MTATAVHADTSDRDTGSQATIDNASDTEIEVLDLSDIRGGYLSDVSEMEDDVQENGYETDEDEFEGGDQINVLPPPLISEISVPEYSFSMQPPTKRRKLAVPACETRRIAHVGRLMALRSVLIDIEKLVASKQTKFEAGHNSLQAYRARAIQSCLHMVVNNHRRSIDASERAAEGQGFAGKWGGRLVRTWVSRWLKSRELPESEKGCHGKVYSLLDAPEVCHELRAYLRSNIHQSEVICSTVGHLTEAGQTLEYGKNYEGYWTGELFVKQA